MKRNRKKNIVQRERKAKMYTEKEKNQKDRDICLFMDKKRCKTVCYVKRDIF